MRSVSKWAFAGVLALGSAGIAEGAVVTFSGSDDFVGKDAVPRPISDATAAAFDTAGSALGTITLLNLDSLATGFSAVTNLGGGVTATFTDASSFFSGIATNASAGADGELGFAISGPNFLQAAVDVGKAEMNLTFSFAQPVQGFGAYFTGIESNIPGSFTLNFNDGTSQSLALPEGLSSSTPDGGAPAAFFGFTSAGAAITSVTLTERAPLNGARDVIGIDNIRIVSGAPVPIPDGASLGLLGAAMIGGVTWLRRRRKALL